MAEKRKMTRSERWFEDNVTENKREIALICGYVEDSIHEQANITTGRDGLKNSLIYAVVVDATFEEIRKFFTKKQQEGYKAYSIRFGKNFNIGYRNDANDSYEKEDTFHPVLEYIEESTTVLPVSGTYSPEETIQLMSFRQWHQKNTKECLEDMSHISAETFHNLASKNFALLYQESVVPILCTFIDKVVFQLKLMYTERAGTGTSEVSINVMGLFMAYYSIDEDTQKEIVDFEPLAKMKQDYKSDANSGV